MVREPHDGSRADPGWGGPTVAISLLCALVGAVLVVSGMIGAALAGLSGSRPQSAPFLAGAGFGGVAILAAVVSWQGTSRPAVRTGLVIAALIGGLVVIVGAGGAFEHRAHPLACRNWESPPGPTSGGTVSVLNGVAANSASDVWAVGRCWTGSDRTLILHWDGATWTRQPSPNVGEGFNRLNGVAATSASNAWAVGEYAPEGGVSFRSLILHWDGTAWRRQPSPTDEVANTSLFAVAAISSSDAWAVGTSNSGALILHWDGTVWSRYASPDVGADAFPSLMGVAATSSSNAWAVGGYGGFGVPVRAVIFHWDGTVWERQSVRAMGAGDNYLTSIAGISPSNAWAVGWYMDGTEPQALILHWDGAAWEPQPTSRESAGTYSRLSGIAAESRSNAWAVGGQGGTRGESGMVLCWNGTAWEEQSSLNEGGNTNTLNGVAALPSSNAWAVGLDRDGTAARMPVGSCEETTDADDR